MAVIKMGFFDFIKRLFKGEDAEEDLDSIIAVSDGRATCKVCDKELDGNVYTIKGNRSYYCRKHAIELAHKIRQEPKHPSIKPTHETHPDYKPSKNKTQTKPVAKTYIYRINREYPGHCEFHGCTNKPTGLDVYHCRYCEKYHCPKHRIAEDHNCTGNLKSLEKKGVASYSRR
jgi:hypothetical protein